MTPKEICTLAWNEWLDEKAQEQYQMVHGDLPSYIEEYYVNKLKADIGSSLPGLLMYVRLVYVDRLLLKFVQKVG